MFHNRIVSFFLSSIYVFFLIHVYKSVSLLYSYMGYLDNLNYHSYIFYFLFLLAIVPALFLDQTLWKPSSLVLYAVYFVVYIPSVIIPYAIGTLNNTDIILYSLDCLLSLLFLIWFVSKPIYPGFKLNLRRYSLVINIFSFILIALLALLIVYFCLPVLSFAGIEDGYKQRAVAAAYMSTIKLPGFEYIFAWFCNVVIVVFLAFGLIRKRILFVSFAIVMSFFMYGVFAEKSTLAEPLLLTLLYYFFLFFKNIRLNHIAILFITIIVFSNLSLFWLEIVVRRVIMTPGLLASWYLQFFSNHPITYMSDSFLKGIIDYPFGNLRLPYAVSMYMIGRGFDANANFLAYSMPEMGWAGPILVSVLLGVFLRYYDGIALRLKEIKYGYYVLSIISLVNFINFIINTSLFISFLTGGGLLMIVILYLIYCVLGEKNKNNSIRSSFELKGVAV